MRGYRHDRWYRLHPSDAPTIAAFTISCIGLLIETIPAWSIYQNPCYCYCHAISVSPSPSVSCSSSKECRRGEILTRVKILTLVQIFDPGHFSDPGQNFDPGQKVPCVEKRYMISATNLVDRSTGSRLKGCFGYLRVHIKDKKPAHPPSSSRRQ